MHARRQSLLATTMLASLSCLGAPVALGLVAALAPSAATAQDYTSGTLTGQVADAGGAPVAGARVTVRAQSTGVSQTSTTDANGTFRAPLIPTGAYTVTIAKDGFATSTESNLAVRIGGESNYVFSLIPAGGDVSEVVVVAKKAQPQLDFSQTTKGVAIDVEQLQKQVPIGRDVTSVALLAPGVVAAVGGGTNNGQGVGMGMGFTNTDGSATPAIGGGSAGENAFFLNGLNITNFDTYVGAATVPFDFYKTIEVKTGGYPAEFGRATGGVINAVTKSGTNNFYFGVHGNYQPSWAQETAPNTYTSDNARARSDVAQTSIEGGGPLIRDHLFFYGLYQFNSSVVAGASNTGGSYFKSSNTSPFYGYKIDAFVTSRQHLEFTEFNTTQIVHQNNALFTPPVANYTSPINNLTYISGGDAMGALGAPVAGTTAKNGGNNYVAKYTGSFTDWFTLSGAYGRSHDEAFALPDNASLPYVTDTRLNGSVVRLSPTVTTAGNSVQRDTTFREFYRIDGDAYVNFLGRHHFRGGYDNEATTLNHSLDLAGAGSVPESTRGALIQYYRLRSQGAATANGLPLGQEYVRVVTEDLGGGGASVSGTNEAFYLQDSWDVTRQLNIQLGVRDDIFNIKNLAGETAIDLKDNWAPRIAVSYDPFGHKTDKIFASYGRYFIPPASNLSFRGADFFQYQYFLPPSGLSFNPYIDPQTGVPTQLGAILGANTTFGQANGSTSICPPGIARAGQAACINLGNGTQEPGATKAARNLEASSEDEIIVGYQKKLGSLWSVSATVTYRNLGVVSEDIDNLDQGIIHFCGRAGNASHAGCNLSAADITAAITTLPDYVVINPGKTAVVQVRKDAPTVDPNTGMINGVSPIAGQTFALTKEDLGFPTPKREYYALELAFDRAFDGKWSLAGSYTLSKSVGNYEGTVKSDAGNAAQSDAGSTQDFDYPGLEDYQYGLLPNHRAHQFKLYGSYQLFSNLLVGANLQVISPRHYGCIGYYPYQTDADGNGIPNAGGYGGVDPSAAGYRSASRYCYNQTLGYSTPTPRGDSFEGDWFYQFDMSVRYSVPKFTKYMPGNLVLRVDAFNLFNSQQVGQNDEVGDIGTGQVSGTYKLPLSYQTPRYVRFGFDLTF